MMSGFLVILSFYGAHINRVHVEPCLVALVDHARELLLWIRVHMYLLPIVNSFDCTI